MNLLEEIKKYGPSATKDTWCGHNLDLDVFSKRETFVKNYAWGTPDEGALKEIKDFVKSGKILEIGSGLGLWAKLIQDMGVRITPTNPAGQNTYINLEKEPFTNISAMDHKEALEAFGGKCNTLMLCWPPYGDPMAYEALNEFKGDKLIYIGESETGCCATDSFFKLISKNWVMFKVVYIQKWLGLHDSLFLYKRK